MHKIVIFSLLTIIALPGWAQKETKDKKEERKQRISAMIKQEEEGVISYHKHNLFGLKLTNDGYGFFYEHGRTQSVNRALLFQLDFAERKHSKEQKQSDIYVPTAPFIFGKVNFFYPLKLGVQQQVLLGNKGNKNGVAVTTNFGGGVTLGLLRPYYLEVSDTNSTGRRQIKYDGPDSLLFANPAELANLRVSGTGLSNGWGELKMKPGLYAKGSLRFDYGRYNEVISALEVGLTAEYYFSKIPQLINIPQKNLFMNVYVALLFGKRK